MEIKMQSWKRNVYMLLLAISVGSMSVYVVNPYGYGYGTSFINSVTALTGPKPFDSIIRNLDLQDLKSIKPTRKNISDVNLGRVNCMYIMHLILNE